MIDCGRLFQADSIKAFYSEAQKVLVISAEVTVNPYFDLVHICRNPLESVLPAPAVPGYMVVGTTRPGMRSNLVVKRTIFASFAVDVKPAKVAVYSMGVDNPARTEISVGTEPPPTSALTRVSTAPRRMSPAISEADDGGSTFWNIVGNAANIIGIVTGAVQLGDWIVSFVNSGSIDSSDAVLQRIDVLDRTLAQEIETVGDQIKAQIQDLDNFIKSETVVDLVSRAKTAESELHDYYVAADPSTKGPLLANADQDTTYVSQYVQTSPNLAYLAALTLGGTVRLDIIRVLDPQYRADPVYKAEIASLIALLNSDITLRWVSTSLR